MAQIGSPQNIDLPVIGTDGDLAAATKLLAALNTIIGAVEGTVPFSAVDWTTDKSAGNNGLDDVKYLGLFETSVSTDVSGRLENISGDVWWVHEDGAVQITTGNALNAASLGGIVGDYGSGDPAKLTYYAATDLFEFTESPGAYAYVKGLEFWIAGSGSGQTQLASTATDSETWTFPPLPATQTLLQVDENGTIAASNTIADEATFSSAVALDGGATLAAGQTLKHGDKKQRLSVGDAINVSGTQVYTLGGLSFTTDGSVDFVIPNEVGTRLKAITLRLSKANTSATTLTVKKRDDSGSVTSIDTTSSTTSGYQTITLTLGTPESLADSITTRWYFSLNGYTGDYLTVVQFTYDRIA